MVLRRIYGSIKPKHRKLQSGKLKDCFPWKMGFEQKAGAWESKVSEREDSCVKNSRKPWKKEGPPEWLACPEKGRVWAWRVRHRLAWQAEDPGQKAVGRLYTVSAAPGGMVRSPCFIKGSFFPPSFVLFCKYMNNSSKSICSCLNYPANHNVNTCMHTLFYKYHAVCRRYHIVCSRIINISCFYLGNT